METIILLILILWFLGYITIPGLVIPRIPLFYINRHPVTLWEILVFLIILWAIRSLPDPFKKIVGIILIIWLLSTFGIIALGGLSNLLILIIILSLVIALFR